MIRERANGWYSVPAYITWHTLYGTPYVLFLVVVAFSISYWLVVLAKYASRLIIFAADLFV